MPDVHADPLGSDAARAVVARLVQRRDDIREITARQSLLDSAGDERGKHV